MGERRGRGLRCRVVGGARCRRPRGNSRLRSRPFVAGRWFGSVRGVRHRRLRGRGWLGTCLLDLGQYSDGRRHSFRATVKATRRATRANGRKGWQAGTIRRPNNRVADLSNKKVGLSSQSDLCGGSWVNEGKGGRRTECRSGRCWCIERYGTRRIGEATNQGPGSHGLGHNEALEASLSYPAPLKPGFRCIRTPGFEETPWAGEVGLRREWFRL